MAPEKGSIVLYTEHLDSDASETPNISPAMVVEVNGDATLDLWIFFSNGFFNKLQVPKGIPGQRGTWHLKGQ